MTTTYTSEQKTQIALAFERTKSIVLTQRELQRTLGIRPDKNTIRSIHKRLTETGSVTVTPSRTTERTVTSPVMVRRVRELVQESNSRNEPTSTRRLARKLTEEGNSISHTSVHLILRSDLGMKPYHQRPVHELKPIDKPRRVAMARSLLSKIREDPDFLDKVVWTDEAKFELSGAVNSHNTIFWDRGNPEIRVETKRIDQHGVMVWAGISSFGRYGPFEVSGRLTGQRYLDLLRDHIIPSLGDTSQLWFMQDGAPAHKARVVTQYLREVFGDRVIALGWDPEWAPRSPDVTPCDFFLWGYMKDKVYGKRLANRIALKEKIWEVFPSIEQEKIRDACRGVERKLQDLVELEGEHIQFARGR